MFFCMLGTLVSTVSGQRAVAPPTGVVTGHVVLEDTQRPGRLITVALVPKPAEDSKMKETPAQMITARTGLDGSFNIPSAPLGEYWVVAQSEGYILPFRDAVTEAEQKSPAKIMAAFPTVLVTAERPAEAAVTLQRGGVVSGHMRYDDGTPVSGVTLMLLPDGRLRGSDGRNFMAVRQITGSHECKTNDIGAFRISGVAPGKYRLQASMQVYGGATAVVTRNSYAVGQGNEIWMNIYAPGTLHKAASPVLEIRSSEEIADADITVNLSSMHAVTGRVVSKEDQHALNEGVVSLKDPDDKDLTYRSVLGRDGRFIFPYVPEGTFELSFEGSGDASEPTDPSQPWNRKTLQSYGNERVPLIVTNQDITIPDVALLPKKPSAKSPEAAAKADE